MMKRKFKDEAEASEHEAETPPVKRPRGGGNGPSWTEEQDETLASLYREHKAKGTKGLWNVIYETFRKKYPEANKTTKAMQRRFEDVSKDGSVELDDEEMDVFEKAVHDIDNQRVRHEAIAWRFGQISKSTKTLNKTAVGKLLKKIKSRKNGASKGHASDSKTGEDAVEDAEQGVRSIKLEKDEKEDGEKSEEYEY